MGDFYGKLIRDIIIGCFLGGLFAGVVGMGVLWLLTKLF